MKKMKKIFVIIITICAVLIIKEYIANRKINNWLNQEYYTGEDNIEIINSRIGIILPDNLTLINDKKNFVDEYFYFKFLVQYDDLDIVQNELVSKISSSYYITDDNDTNLLPNFDISCKWFNISKDEVMVYYTSFWTVRKNGTKTSHQIYAFLCKEGNKYYLYLSF